MELNLISHFLPSQLLLHFSVTSVVELCTIQGKQVSFNISLEDDNHILLDVDCPLYESKGFTEITLQDFPIRGKEFIQFLNEESGG